MSNNAKTVWDYLKKQYINDYGCAGILGNLYAESGLNPKNLQDYYEKKLKMTDEEYTKAVDNNTYDNFIKDGAGYGLAQWTFWSRKEGLYKLAKSMKRSIGDMDVQLAYLYAELKALKWFDSSVKNAKSVNDASDFILLNFERPADTSDAMKKKRREFAMKYYNEFAAAGTDGSTSSTTGNAAPAYTAAMLGHASIDENGNSAGGAPGDQTGKEVCITTWYDSGRRNGTGGWDTVLRPKSSALAEKMAQVCEWLCTSNFVGYDQSQRNTLYNELEKLNWDYTKLKTKCETDCSALMGTCAKAAGSNVQRIYGNCCYTGNEEQLFLASGDFIALKDEKYLRSAQYLKRGDVLLRTSGHTAMSLTDGSLAGGNNNTNTSYVTTKNPYIPPIFTVKYGSKGIGVKWVQFALYKAGFGTGALSSFVDGEFGSITKAAVLKFQSVNGLKVDGEVGSKTRAALKKVG